MSEKKSFPASIPFTNRLDVTSPFEKEKSEDIAEALQLAQSAFQSGRWKNEVTEGIQKLARRTVVIPSDVAPEVRTLVVTLQAIGRRGRFTTSSHRQVEAEYWAAVKALKPKA